MELCIFIAILLIPTNYNFIKIIGGDIMNEIIINLISNMIAQFLLGGINCPLAVEKV